MPKKTDPTAATAAETTAALETDTHIDVAEATPSLVAEIRYCDQGGNEIDRETRELEIDNGRVVITITHMMRATPL